MTKRTALLGVGMLVAVWLAAVGATAADRGVLSRGGQAYLAQCAACHGPFGAGDGPLVPWLLARRAPHPARLDDPARMRTLGVKGVQEIVSKGGAHVGRSSTMPTWGPHLGRVLEAEVSAWVVALPAPSAAQRAAVERWLTSPTGSVPDGRSAYVLHCAGCHGPRGAGDGYFAPALRARMAPRDLGAAATFTGVSDDSLSALLSPGGAHAPNAPWMPGWMNALDPATVDAVVSYLRVLRNSPPAH